MTRTAIIIAVVWLALTVYSLVDVIMIDRFRVRGVPKGLWIVFIIILPLVGAALWFLVGRGKTPTRPSRSVAPDDDPDFLRGLSFPPSDGPEPPRG